VSQSREKEYDKDCNMEDIDIRLEEIEKPNEEPGILAVPDLDRDRYATFGLISWWQQQRLQQATVIVVGAGALGNEVLKNLALMGIGRVIVVDFDVIEPDNLSRAVLFRPQDAGKPKSTTAANALRELNPEIEVYALQSDVRDLGWGVFRRADVIVGCLDNREARLAVNQACYRVGRPWVDGGINELLGQVIVFVPGQGACYECTLSEADQQVMSRRLSCPLLARENLAQGKVPTTPTIASIVGAMQCQEVMKLLHDMPVQPGKALIINGLTNELYPVAFSPKSECMSHYMCDQIIELPDARSKHTTWREILGAASEALGGPAALELNREVVLALECWSCQTQEDIMRPLSKVTENTARCPRCGQVRQPMMTHRVDASSSFLDRSPGDLGIPPLHILTARSGEKTCYLELTGDKPEWAT
jgi:molybdopterin/thiamine biosynthesis adenylyltransferase